jgi:GTP 3',8-cyclase
MKKILNTQTGLNNKSMSPKKLIFDQFGRTFNYLRLAVNEMCNLRCIYCMPEDGIDFKSKDKILSKSEIFKLVQITSEMGVSKVRFTGGEPLLRKDIIDIIKYTKSISTIDSVHLTTNGILLPSFLNPLEAIGLDGINISIDTLNREKYKIISRRDSLDQVIGSLKKAMANNILKIKINVVAMRNFNDDELGDFIELTKENNITVRFIELMPFDSHQIWKTGKFYKAKDIISDVKSKYNNLIIEKGSSTEHHIFRVKDYKGKVAIIPSYTRSLCGQCNRLRITADGNLLNCLYSQNEINLLNPIRKNFNDSELKNIIKKAMFEKSKDGWEAHKKNSDFRNSMTQIGG